jgi:hypothetical protein
MGCVSIGLLASARRGREEEDHMFQMIDEEKPPENRKELLMKIGMFLVALAALGGMIYFFGFH